VAEELFGSGDFVVLDGDGSIVERVKPGNGGG
jgi:hypothetical protein